MHLAIIMDGNRRWAIERGLPIIAGHHKGVKTLKKVVQLNAARIVYVSCNPATQARDTKYLLNEGYQLKKLSFVDQFPHTSHVESIALFEK